MIDIGKSIYEERKYFFNEIEVWKIILNPEAPEYPPLFLLCCGTFGSDSSAFAIGLSFAELNKLITSHTINTHRLAIALHLANAINGEERYAEIDLDKLLGDPLTISGLKLTTSVECYDKGCWDECPLYFFRFTGLHTS